MGRVNSRNYRKSEALQARMTLALESSGALTLAQLAELVGVSVSVANYHTKKLAVRGQLVLVLEPHRGQLRYRCYAADVAAVLERWAA
jgi:predicted ArsR family transcriptional regulator